MQTAAPRQHQTGTATGHEEAPGFGGRRPSVLIVDDSQANLAHLARILDAQGLEPRRFTRGRPALASAQVDPPDVILLDIEMPEMDGFAVCESLKANERLSKIPVIFISGLSDTHGIVQAFSLGGADYVTKPFQDEEVTARVWTHLRIRSLQRQLSAQNERLEVEVSERTRELADANQRLQELGRLKGDFVKMISHEIRTPANGVLGIGQLVFDLCPPSADLETYRQHFNHSSVRLINLIEDATLIADLVTLTQKAGAPTPFAVILSRLRARLRELVIALDDEVASASILVHGDPELLLRAMTTMMRLAATFSVERNTVRLTLAAGDGILRLQLRLDALSLAGSDVDRFFEIESLARSSSRAEPLGLAPVVAHKIIAALGGALRLVKDEGNSGLLEARLPTALPENQAAGE
jgi:two-component system sensor histidine kinase/response regulator